MLREGLVDGREIQQPPNAVAVLHLQPQAEAASQHAAGLVHLSLQNCLADAGGADRLPVQCDRFDHIDLDSVAFGNPAECLCRARTAFSEGKVVAAAELLGAHALDQHLFDKFLRLHILKAGKIRHDHLLKAHPFQNGALLLIRHQGKIILFNLGNEGGDGIGKDAGSQLPVLQRLLQHLRMPDVDSVKQPQRYRRRLAGIRPDKLLCHLQALVSSFPY